MCTRSLFRKRLASITLPWHLAFTALFFLRAYGADTAWVSTIPNLTGNGTIYTLAASGNGHLFAGTESGGIFRANYTGDGWVPADSGYPNADVYRIQVLTNGMILAATHGSGVIRSTDDGNTWLPSGTGLTNQTCNDLIVMPNGTLFCGTEGGPLYRSLDSGSTWTQTSFSGGTVDALLASSDGSVFAGSADLGVFVSTNNGDTWTQTSLDNLWVPSLAENSSGTVFAGTRNGIYHSSDNGTSWALLGLSASTIEEILVDGQQAIYAGTAAEGLFCSTDDGASWLPFNTGLTNLSVYSLLLTPDRMMLAGTLGGGLFKRSMASVTWEDMITVSNCDTTATLTFGQADSATDCIDSWLGEYMLPPVGPSEVFDARFVLPCLGGPGSVRDFRNDSLTSVIWTLQFQSGTCGYPIVLHWNPRALPEGNFQLRDGFRGDLVNVDMKRESTFTLSNAGIASLLIVRRPTICVDVPVRTGWNIVSVPVETPSPLVDSLFPGHTTPPYKFVPPQGYVRSDSMYPGHGYWLKFAGDTSYSICGLSVFPRVIHLNTGWNLIGPFECPVNTADIVITPAQALDSYYFGYDRGYQIDSLLLPGKGYWVHVNQPATMTIPECFPGPGGPTAQKTEPAGDLVVVSFVDQQGQGGRLYLSDGADAEQSLMPPSPPEGSADIRFVSNQMVEKLGTGSHPISISSAVYPIRVTVENTRGIRLELRSSTGALALEPGKPVTLQAEEVLLSLSETTGSTPVPKEFALSQNYPNPFNPTTTISYALPTDSRVTMIVYDVLGNEVATLVNGQETAGFKSVTWNAAGVASGTYFCRIQAGRFLAFKKMLLLK